MAERRRSRKNYKPGPLTGPPRLRNYEAMRILLYGVTGANMHEIKRGSGLPRRDIERFMGDDGSPTEDVVEALGFYIWRQMNAHLLLCDDDRQPVPPKLEVDATWYDQEDGIGRSEASNPHTLPDIQGVLGDQDAGGKDGIRAPRGNRGTRTGTVPPVD